MGYESLQPGETLGCFDSDKQVFEVYFKSSVDSIPVECNIWDDASEMMWGCYLVKVKYLKKTKRSYAEFYLAEYKKF
jgi:hypothetical protein